MFSFSLKNSTFQIYCTHKSIKHLFQVSVTLSELGLDHKDGYHILDLYDDYDYGIVTPDRRFKVDVNPSGSKNCFIFEFFFCKRYKI